MSLKLILHTRPDVPLEAESLSPDRLAGMDESAVASVQVQHGNQPACVGDFFKVEGRSNGELHLEGDLSRIKYIGSMMSGGKTVIHGNAGAHLGAGMSGGEIVVEGDAGDWVGPEMTGGRITVRGNAGHLIGSAYRGSTIGMQDGEIIIHGNVKNELGHAMRNGLIAVGGNSGDFTGVNMLAGTIIIMGEPGIRSGAGMKRGTIISMNDTELLPTFSYSCKYRPVFMSLLLQYLLQLDMKVDDNQLRGEYHRWCGDSVEMNRGEILVYRG